MTDIMQDLFAPRGSPEDATREARELAEWLDRTRPGWRAIEAHPLPRVVRDLYGMWSDVLDRYKGAEAELGRSHVGQVDALALVLDGIEEPYMRDACRGLLDDLRALDVRFITFDMMRRSAHWERLRDHLTAQRGKGPQAVTSIVRAVWRHASARAQLSQEDPEPGQPDRGPRWTP